MGSKVVRVTCQQRGGDSEGSRLPEREPEHFRCVAPSSELGTDSVTDVPAYLEEVLVQLMPNGHPANQTTVHVGHQKRCRHPTLREVSSEPRILRLSEVVQPLHTCSIGQQELEVLAKELGVRSSCCGFVIGCQKSELHGVDDSGVATASYREVLRLPYYSRSMRVSAIFAPDGSLTMATQ